MPSLPRPALFIFFGLIASGKSTLGQAFADRNDVRYYNSDVIRKELAGQLAQNGRQAGFDQGIYTKAFTEKTYSALLTRAEADLSAGISVALDASYQDPTERLRVRKLAEQLALPIYFVLCLCPEDEMKRRMEMRALDPKAVSDGRWEIYLQQKERYRSPDELPPGSLITINTDDSVANLLATLERLLAETGATH
ncbi:MAG: AAA family ATPase [Desulfobulbaceae bacterium]|nr:AAA family ATPase [Desulfobulbaceae bacterium]